MEISVWHRQGRVDVTVFSIEGDITVDSCEQLQERFEQEHKLDTRYLLIDLRNVPYMSSSGLRAIQRIFSVLEEHDETVRSRIKAATYKSEHLKLLNPSKEVSQVLKTAGFDMFLEIHTDLEKAIASF